MRALATGTASWSPAARRMDGPGPGAAAPAPKRPGLLKRLGLTPALVGFLTYIFVIITARLPLGELGVAIGFLGLFLQRVRIRVPTYLGWHFAFVAWSILTIGWTASTALTVEMVTQSAKLWLIMLLGANAVRSRVQWVVLALFILFWFFVYPVRGTILNYAAGITQFGRAAWNGVLGNPNYLAAACLVPLSAASALMVVWRRRLVVVVGLPVLGILIGVMILTQSRGGLLALFVFGVIAIIGNRKPGKAIVATVVLAMAVLALAPDDAWDRLGGLANVGGRSDTDWRTVDEEGSAEQRLRIAQTALKIIGDHPIGGTGTGTYPIMNERYDPGVGRMDPHNTYLHVAAEQGLVGLVLFLGIFTTALRHARARAQQIAAFAPQQASALRLLSAGLIGFLIAGIWGSYDNFQILHVMVLLVHLGTRLSGSDSRGGTPAPVQLPDRALVPPPRVIGA
jgi:O-antigen ligase